MRSRAAKDMAPGYCDGVNRRPETGQAEGDRSSYLSEIAIVLSRAPSGSNYSCSLTSLESAGRVNVAVAVLGFQAPALHAPIQRLACQESLREAIALSGNPNCC